MSSQASASGRAWTMAHESGPTCPANRYIPSTATSKINSLPSVPPARYAKAEDLDLEMQNFHDTDLERQDFAVSAQGTVLQVPQPAATCNRSRWLPAHFRGTRRQSNNAQRQRRAGRKCRDCIEAVRHY